jgi:FMN phosphatase YigB (HAD superfamily)
MSSCNLYVRQASQLLGFVNLHRSESASSAGKATGVRMSSVGGPRITSAPMIESVFFDVGETIVDETREYGTWADWLGVPRHTFSAVFGAIIARGGDYRETFQVFRPGFDLAWERQKRFDAGQPEMFSEADLYPDARPCLASLKAMGLLVGLAGNQTSRAEDILHSLELPVDLIGTSEGWGVEKPSPAFFERLIAEAGCPAEEVLYVGRSAGQRRPSGAGLRPADNADSPRAVGIHTQRPGSGKALPVRYQQPGRAAGTDRGAWVSGDQLLEDRYCVVSQLGF